ncbi:MAG: hypothetical protein HQ539_02120 [Parcubacteria group bacterium]|nr:hypothetical protein [Parcubacteria group bacterium]
MKAYIIISIIIFCLFGGSIGYFISDSQNVDFAELSPEAMFEQITTQRAFAIEKAVERGDYRCCISPACTMCYTEANQWNNWTAGTCACDDLIVQGKEPCPQCKKGIGDEASCGGATTTEQEESCEVNLDSE